MPMLKQPFRVDSEDFTFLPPEKMATLLVIRLASPTVDRNISSFAPKSYPLYVRSKIAVEPRFGNWQFCQFCPVNAHSTSALL